MKLLIGALQITEVPQELPLVLRDERGVDGGDAFDAIIDDAAVVEAARRIALHA